MFKKITTQRDVSLVKFISFLLAASLFLAPVFLSNAFADQQGVNKNSKPPFELIVKFYLPQEDEASTKSNFRLVLGSTMWDKHFSGITDSVELVNPELGVVRLKLPSGLSEQGIKKVIGASRDVANVTKNNFYKISLFTKIKIFDPEKNNGAYESEGVFGDDVPGRVFGSTESASSFSAEDSEAPYATAASPLFSLFNSYYYDAFKLPALPIVEKPAQFITRGFDPLVMKDWAIHRINVDRLGVNNANGVIVAVLDTGVDYNHPDLIHAMWRMPGNYRVVGRDFAHKRLKPYDYVHFDLKGCYKDFWCKRGRAYGFLENPGHGTHCAGHVAAVANNSEGIQGSGAGARIMALKFFYDYGHERAGQGSDAGAIQSIDYAIKRGVKIISASWGSRLERSMANVSALKIAIYRAKQAGALFVVAAGNNGINQDKDELPVFPAAFSKDLDNIIVVAASDKMDRLAGFSNYGARSVHIAAPGTQILSTVSGGDYSDIIADEEVVISAPCEEGSTELCNKKKRMLIEWNGTSMATPFVAGAAARIWAQYPNENYKQIKERILATARKTPGLQGKIITGGVLDVTAALNYRQ